MMIDRGLIDWVLLQFSFSPNVFCYSLKTVVCFKESGNLENVNEIAYLCENLLQNWQENLQLLKVAFSGEAWCRSTSFDWY
jgi:hypothetical protein